MEVEQKWEENDEFLYFHIEQCSVYLNENITYPLVGGFGSDYQCPNKMVKVNFLENSRIQGKVLSVSEQIG